MFYLMLLCRDVLFSAEITGWKNGGLEEWVDGMECTPISGQLVKQHYLNLTPSQNRREIYIPMMSAAFFYYIPP